MCVRTRDEDHTPQNLKLKKRKVAAKPKVVSRATATQRVLIDGYSNKLFIYTLGASKHWWVRLYVGGRVVKKITRLSTQGLSSSTISTYMRLANKVLTYAHRKRLIPSVPQASTVRVADKARGWFTTREYRRLYAAAQRYVGKKIEVRKYVDDEGETQTQYVDAATKRKRLGKLMRNVSMTEDMRRLIVFMVNGYIRPRDIKYMQHQQ